MSSSRVWVITGANSGLGFSLALYVASQGDKVVGTVRSLSKFPEQLRAAGVVPLVADLSGPDDEVKSSGEAALKVFGHVDVLVNNAGYGVIGPIEELKVSDIRAQFQTNFFGLIAFTQPFITHFRTRRTGHIVNVSSRAGSAVVPAWGAYCASKGALDSFSDVLSLELKLFGVRVLDVKPGYFATPLFSKLPSHGTPAEESSHEDGSEVPLSQVYTDPETQGYDIVRRLTRVREGRLVGDPEKYAQRVYEVVTGTGLAEDVVARPTADGQWEGPWELNQVPLGTSCLVQLKKQVETLGENLRVFEHIANSTDVEQRMR